MTDHADLLTDTFERVQGLVHRAVDGLTPDELVWRPAPDANSIGWLVWHLTRIKDDHVAGAAGLDQVWLSAGWCQRFALPYEDTAHGYGQSTEDVAAFSVPSGDLLLGYHDAVHEQTMQVVAALSEADLDRVVDESWDPPVTYAVRLVSVISDTLQHAGQAAYVRGLLPLGVDGHRTAAVHDPVRPDMRIVHTSGGRGPATAG